MFYGKHWRTPLSMRARGKELASQTPFTLLQSKRFGSARRFIVRRAVAGEAITVGQFVAVEKSCSRIEPSWLLNPLLRVERSPGQSVCQYRAERRKGSKLCDSYQLVRSLCSQQLSVLLLDVSHLRLPQRQRNPLTIWPSHVPNARPPITRGPG